MQGLQWTSYLNSVISTIFSTSLADDVGCWGDTFCGSLLA